MDVETAIKIVKAIRRPGSSDEPPPPRHTALPGERPNPTGFVYFAYCAGRIKIGFTTSVADRMSGLATSSPFPVSLLLTITGDIEDERAFQKRFAADRVNLEWFAASEDLLNFLESKLCPDGAAILTNAQFESRTELLACAADIANQTGGDDNGCFIESAPWPGLLRAV